MRRAVLVYMLGILTGITLLQFIRPAAPLAPFMSLTPIDRIHEVLNYVEAYYFEQVDENKLVEGAIKGIFEHLDPHTTYIPRERFQDVTERFEGHFEGIGVDFIIQNDFPVIVSPIPGSPSDRLGIRPADVIVEIEGESTRGMSDLEVMNRLRGERGTTVRIKIRRPGRSDLLAFRIIRDEIALQSVIAAFMYDEQTAFIKLTHFARTTSDELSAALDTLAAQGMQQLVLDLRNNSGGYLDQAVAVADHFLPANKKIVFTRGRIKDANEIYYSTNSTPKTEVPLIVLISHGSASASEIVAGAIQDYDRGLIVGERSFGKGLVQNQIALLDGSAVRITVAQYFTPSGRPIQRRYTKDRQAYYEQAFSDELPDSDLSANDTLRFVTAGGRKVYGGGGITPDLPLSWAGKQDSLLVDLLQKGLFFEYAAQIGPRFDGWRKDIRRFQTQFQVVPALLEDFKKFASEKGIPVPDAAWVDSREAIAMRLKAELARVLWGTPVYHEVWFKSDPRLQQVVAQFGEARRILELASRILE